METIEVTAAEFKRVIPNPYFIFGGADFAELNKDKAEKVYYLLFKDSKYRLGITGGLRDNTFFSPFSAPYGGFVYLNKDIRLRMLDEAINSLTEWAKKKGIETFNITIPPAIFDESFVSKQINAFYRNHFKIENIDLNYSFELNKFNDSYSLNIWYNARKNLHIALNNELLFKLCTDDPGKNIAYEIIRRNRKARGYPLNMSYEQITKTAELIHAEFFLVQQKSVEAIASAIVFHVADKIVRVIYWGDLPEFSNLRTMNFLSFKIFEYYKKMGINFIDVGISTVNSIPNYGLCEFKESIGCDTTLQYSFHLTI